RFGGGLRHSTPVRDGRFICGPDLAPVREFFGRDREGRLCNSWPKPEECRENAMTFTPTRRRFLQGSAAVAAGAGPPGAARAQAKPLPSRLAYSAISWETNIEEAVRVGERLGFKGVEPFRNNIMNYLDKPLALKKFMTDHHIQMATCSNGG